MTRRPPFLGAVISWAQILLVALVSCAPRIAAAQARAAVVVQWDDPGAAELATIARGALAGGGADVVPEAETSAAIAFVGGSGALDDASAERLRASLGATLYVVAVLAAAGDDLHVALRILDGGTPHNAFGRTTREDLSGYVVERLLAPVSPPAASEPAPVAPLAPAPVGPSSELGVEAIDGGLLVGRRVSGDTTRGSDARNPSCQRGPASPEQTWTFTAPADGTYRFQVDASFDAVLAVHTPDGAELACKVDLRVWHPAEGVVAATLLGGRTYEIVVDGFRGQAGGYQLVVEEGAPGPRANENALIAGVTLVLGLSAATALLGYYTVCEESPLCADHAVLAWIPIAGPFLVWGTQPLPNGGEYFYPAAGFAQVAVATLFILLSLPTRPSVAVDRSGAPSLSFELGPTDGGAMVTLRGRW